MTLSAAAFIQLAAACGPTVHVETLASIAHAESGLDPLAIHDNVTGRTYRPATVADAVRIATDLVAVHRHSTDLGLMQVNSANLPGLRLSIAGSFDPCKNISAGARVLVEGYRTSGAGDPQPALLRALSRYNTGRPDRGFTNGYVRRVQYAGGQIVPAIRLAGSNGPQEGEGEVTPVEPPAAPPPPPPSWDVYARARFLRDNPSASYAPIGSPSSAPVLPAPTARAEVAPPVRLQAISIPAADDR
ncbi:lytic transglycosylase domain-containing protein [Sphingobium indicum]